IALEVGPTGGGVAWAFHADGGIAHLQTHRGMEVCGAAEGSATSEQECREQESLHGTILCWVEGVCASQTSQVALQEYTGPRLQKTSHRAAQPDACFFVAILE